MRNKSKDKPLITIFEEGELIHRLAKIEYGCEVRLNQVRQEEFDERLYLSLVSSDSDLLIIDPLRRDWTQGSGKLEDISKTGKRFMGELKNYANGSGNRILAISREVGYQEHQTPLGLVLENIPEVTAVYSTLPSIPSFEQIKRHLRGK